MLLNRGVADLLLLRTILAIHQKSWEPIFWEVMDSFILWAYASLAASRTCVQWLLACLNFTLELEDLSLWYKRKKWFLWQQHKQLKTMEVSEMWPDISMRDMYISSNLNPLTSSSSRSTEVKYILPWNISQMITKINPVSTRIVISYTKKQGISLWIWWKVNVNWDKNMVKISQWRESHCRTNTSIRRKK